MKRICAALSVTTIMLLSANFAHAQSYTLPLDKPAIIPWPQTPAEVDKLDRVTEYEIPWHGISYKDIVWQKRVCRNIDANLTPNELFRYDPAKPNASLISIIISGVLEGKIKAYDPATQHFNKELTRQQFIDLLIPGSNNPIGCINPANVSTFRIKEDWLLLDTQQIVVVRVLGIAPMIIVTGPDGKVTEREAFWLFYPDIRKYLAEHKVLLGTKEQDTNWDRLFQDRKFNAAIDKMSGYQRAPKLIVDEHAKLMKQIAPKKVNE